MHSRIIQLTREKTAPICEEDFYDHWFTNSIADFVRGDTDVNKDIDWLLFVCNGALKRKNDKIVVVDKSLYFKEKYDEFMNKLVSLKDDIGFDDFCGDGDSFKLYEINTLYDLYNDKYGFYIEDCGEYAGLHTLDKFMRHVKNGDEFYIGETVDYHF